MLGAEVDQYRLYCGFLAFASSFLVLKDRSLRTFMSSTATALPSFGWIPSVSWSHMAFEPTSSIACERFVIEHRLTLVEAWNAHFGR
jgi:hypothetical protein